MIGLTDIIVSFWFLPVTLFIILPLVLLCGHLFLKMVRPPRLKRNASKEKVQLKDAATLTEGS
jgi:hypothetical protein